MVDGWLMHISLYHRKVYIMNMIIQENIMEERILVQLNRKEKDIMMMEEQKKILFQMIELKNFYNKVQLV